VGNMTLVLMYCEINYLKRDTPLLHW